MIESIIKGILDAEKEARKRGIAANAVFIGDALFFSKLQAYTHREVPIVCGLKAYYTNELPNDTLFAVAHSEERERAYTDVVRCKECIHQRKVWRKDGRMKEKGYYIVRCALNDDPFSSHCVGGCDDEFCSSGERKGEGDG